MWVVLQLSPTCVQSPWSWWNRGWGWASYAGWSGGWGGAFCLTCRERSTPKKTNIHSQSAAHFCFAHYSFAYHLTAFFALLLSGGQVNVLPSDLGGSRSGLVSGQWLLMWRQDERGRSWTVGAGGGPAAAASLGSVWVLQKTAASAAAPEAETGWEEKHVDMWSIKKPAGEHSGAFSS